MFQVIERYKKNILIKNYAKVFSVDILVKLSSFILLPVYLRLMTQEAFGLYTYLLAIISSFSLVMNFGLYVAQSKLYQDFQGEEERGSLLFTINVMLLSFLSVCLIATFFSGLDYHIVSILFKNKIDYSSYRNSIFLAITVSVYSFMLFNYFLTSQSIKHVQLYNLLRLIFVNGIVISLLYFYKADSVMIRLKFTYLLELSFLFVFMPFYIKAMRRKFNKELAKKSLTLAMPVMLSAVLGLVLNYSDRFFIEKYGNFKDLAVYNLGFVLAGIIPMMFMTFQNIWLPHFFKEKNLQVNKEKTFSVIIKAAVFFFLLSLLIILTFKLLLVFQIIDMKYGKVLYLLPILLLTQIFSAITPLYSNYIIFFEKTFIALFIGVPLAVASIVLNLLLIPQYGLYGAAFSSFLINFGYLIAYYFIVTHLIKKKTVLE
ncbi:MAG: oligosaccharide flippase family protein [Ignavibacteriaceae bacterium]|jgi:O-antigen/teichoic acid export membrane protein|nr:oligosaccharide flippase family protein [Ignavibacteriaceae bacterium]